MATRSSISPSRFRRQLQRINKHIDWLIVGLLLCILLASFFPAKGSFATGMHYASKVFLFLLFFFYGAKLAPPRNPPGAKELATPRRHLLLHVHPVPHHWGGP